MHSKVAIIDDIWATVGSANLDVFSLSRDDNSEVNAVLFDDAKVQISDFRRRLWAEHLGIADPTQVDGIVSFQKCGLGRQRKSLQGCKRNRRGSRTRVSSISSVPE